MPLQSNSGHHPTPLFWYLGFHGNAILNFINMPKASTHYGEYSYDVSWSLMKETKKIKKSHFFYFHGNCGKACPIDSDFFGLWQECDVDVDVIGNITAKLCEVWSEFNIFCTLVTMTTAAILKFFNSQKLQHTTVDIPTKFHDVWWKESNFFLNLPFFVSMATATKLVQPIPIFLAYLVPLDVDVVPIKFHQFLFYE